MIDATGMTGPEAGETLHGRVFGSGAVDFLPLPAGGALLLTAAVEARAVSEPLGRLLGLPVPMQPWQTETHRGRMLHWISPRSWLLSCDQDDEAALAAAVLRAFPDRCLHACAQSSRISRFGLRGEGAEDLLRQIGFLALEPGGIVPGGFRRTLLAGQPTLVWRIGPTEWQLGVDRDKADHLRGWVLRIMRDEAASDRITAITGTQERRA